MRWSRGKAAASNYDTTLAVICAVGGAAYFAVTQAQVGHYHREPLAVAAVSALLTLVTFVLRALVHRAVSRPSGSVAAATLDGIIWIPLLNTAWMILMAVV